MKTLIRFSAFSILSGVFLLTVMSPALSVYATGQTDDSDTLTDLLSSPMPTVTPPWGKIVAFIPIDTSHTLIACIAVVTLHTPSSSCESPSLLTYHAIRAPPVA